MGLISFVKSAGRKVGLFGGQAAAQAEARAEAAVAEAKERRDEMNFAAGLKGAIGEHGIEIADLYVDFDDGTATIRGTASSQADAEKAVLIVGNHEGVGAVDNQLEVEEPAPPAVYHTVVSGDTLSKISLAQYGVIHLYDDIFEANKPMLEHPDKIYPGQQLRIPALEG